MKRTGFLVLAMMLVMGACGSDSPAESDVSSKGDAKATDAKAKKGSPLIFVPRNRGAPEIIVGGGTRGVGKLPKIQAVVTNTVGLTLEAQPTLYWYLSEAVDAKAELSIVFGPMTQPLVDTALSGPLKPGVQSVSLKEYGVKLDKGVTYQWTIRVVPDKNQSGAKITGGAIERVDADPALAALLSTDDVSARARALADAGVWYDSVNAVSQGIAASPADADLRLQRAELLDSVGLKDIAASDRKAAKGGA